MKIKVDSVYEIASILPYISDYKSTVKVGISKVLSVNQLEIYY